MIDSSLTVGATVPRDPRVAETPEQQTLGRTLRAGRQRFHWLAGVNAYVRLTDVAPDRWRIDVARADSVPSSRRPTIETHRLWWLDGDDVGGYVADGTRSWSDEHTAFVAALVAIIERNRPPGASYASFIIDEHGALVT
jgi:hypothetical protein